VNSALTFAWTADGGTENAYVVDLALSLSGPVFTTPILRDRRWEMPAGIWGSIPPESYVYWRVRGADLGIQPLSVICSEEIWWIYKP
jgi:hypothetical protein